MSFQTCKSFIRSRNTIKDILDENREACDCLIDCQVINTVKDQKSMKDVAKIVHLPLMKRREYFFCAKKTKTTTLFNILSKWCYARWRRGDELSN